MTAFNYKNAYKLAIQTNRELHMTLDSYKVMHEEDQRALQQARAEIAKLREELGKLRMQNAGIE